MNLVDCKFPSLWYEIANFDLILCRNVMIYFARDVSRRLIGQFDESLAGGGWLVVGAVEHDLENFKSFHEVQAAGATLYRKFNGRETTGRVCECAYPGTVLQPAAGLPTSAPGE